MKVTNATYLVELPGDTKLTQVRTEAANKFKIEEAGIKLVAHGQTLNLQESICVQLKDNDTVFVEFDEKNLESNENQMKREKLIQKLQQSPDVHKALAVYKNDERLVKPFLLTAQDYLQQAFRISKYVEDLKKTPEFDPSKLDKRQFCDIIGNGAMDYNKKTQEAFPETYNSFILKNDELLQFRVDQDKAHEEMRTECEKEGSQLSLIQKAELKTLTYKGKDEKFFELQQLEKQNISTVLVEYLFTQIAVMVLIVNDLLKQGEGKQFNDYVQKDYFSDLKDLCYSSNYAMLQMIEVKDLLLGQYIGRQKAVDEAKILEGYQAYIDRLKQAYATELENIKLYNFQADDAEILQRLEMAGGNVQQVVDDLEKERDETDETK